MLLVIRHFFIWGFQCLGTFPGDIYCKNSHPNSVVQQVQDFWSSRSHTWVEGREKCYTEICYSYILPYIIYLFVCCINPHHKQIIALSLPPLYTAQNTLVSLADACSPNVWTHQMKRWTEAYKYGCLGVRWASVKTLLYHLRISARTSLNSLHTSGVSLLPSGVSFMERSAHSEIFCPCRFKYELIASTLY